ncbi:MAG: PQQ-binding-like beta-propeller repeat protein [Acidobacteriota bacterium]|nr:PQQ-binding-like beta-propeller repeat protein [Acidobacteriota bacterium]
MRRVWCALAFGLSAAAVVSAENWPQWRGPMMNGTSGETGLPVKWTADENIAWKLPMPEWSGSTPAIWGNLIFLNVAQGDALSVWCVDRRGPTVLWKGSIGGGNHKERKQNMSSPSPVTDGTAVYALTGTGMLKAFDFKGTPLWTRDIQKEYGRFGLNWGYASSPLLHGDALYVQVLHGMKTDDPSYLLRIDKKSGKTVWKVERPTDAISESPDAYTTPALLKYGTTTEIVVSGGDVVTGHDLASGKELWRFKGLNPKNDPYFRIVASPLVVGEIVIAPSRQNPVVGIKPGGRGDITRTHLAWQFDRGPDVPSPASDGTRLFLVTDNGVVYALDLKTGAVVWGPERLKSGTYSASPVVADGRVYATNEEGLTSVFAAGPKFELLAENPLSDYTLSSPAISEGQIFIRTAEHLVAIGKRKESAPTR